MKDRISKNALQISNTSFDSRTFDRS